jgi:hypothetical protein
MKTQLQMFYDAQRRAFDLNCAFIDMVQDKHNPLTRAELEKLIAKRPLVYGRFSNWLDKLP